MKWTPEAEEAISKVPFFVRKKVMRKVELHAQSNGHGVVGLNDITQAKEDFIKGMAKEVTGFKVENCFGASGCPHQACDTGPLLNKIKGLMEKEKILDFLKANVDGDLKFHHEFRIAGADCPNACSQPQIKDMGIIGALRPTTTQEICSQCEACVEVCKEGAITLEDDGPDVNLDLCLFCGECIKVCPTGTLTEDKKGFRVQLGGHLGRHPRLAMEIPGILNEKEVIEVVERSIRFYKKNSKNGKRFAHILEKSDVETMFI